MKSKIIPFPTREQRLKDKLKELRKLRLKIEQDGRDAVKKAKKEIASWSKK